MPILAVSYSISSMSLSCRVQKIWSHKITNAYRTMKHGLLQGLTAPIVMGMSQYLNFFFETSIFAVSNGTSFVSVEGRVQEIQSHKFTRVHQNHKNGLFHGLTAPHLMGMSQYFYIPLYTSVFAASNGPSLMSIGGRVQEIQLDKFTHVHQNRKTWLTSPAYSSKSDGDVTPIM